jgi:capsular exopolysaccharide synthesis family protein
MEDRKEQRENGEVALVPKREKGTLTEYPKTPEIVRAYPVVEEDTELLRYLEIILRRKGIILTFFTVVFVTVLIGSLLKRPVYKATATLEISPESPKIVKFEDVVAVQPSTGEFYETQYKLLKSRSLARRVIDKLDLSQYPEFSSSGTEKSGQKTGLITDIVQPLRKGSSNNDEISVETGKDSIVDSFLSRVEISPEKDSQLLNISFEARDRELAAKTVNTLADTFIEWDLNRKLNATKEGRDFLKKQLEQTQASLERSEEELNAYAKRSDIISLDEKMNLTYHQFSELNDALAKAETDRLAKESLYKSVSNENAESIPGVVNDPYIQGLKAEYAKLKAEYSQLSAIFKPEYPTVKELGAKLAEMNRKVQEGISNRVGSIKSDYEAALKKEELLRKSYEEQKQLTSNLNEKAVQYRILQREVDTNKSIYESLLQRLKETEVTSGIKASNIQVIDYASIPLFPFKPRIALNLLLAAVIGLFGGAFIAFLVEYLDSTIKSPEEIRDRMRFPVLGGIFKINEEKELGFPVEKTFILSPTSHFAEAFRMIRVSLLLSTPGSPPRSILITSCFPAEGKTTVSINLAASFAQAGDKVLLLEADLRRPKIGRIFGRNGNSAGLTNYLTGNATLEEVIMEGGMANLSILPVGPTPVNPAELLGSDEMRKLLEKLSKDYSYIIVDGPPVLGFVDSLIVSNIVDRTVLVASVGGTQRQALREVIEKILSIKSNFLGIIVNRIELNHNNYYYRRYDYYYGESSPENVRKKKMNLMRFITKSMGGKQ